MNTNEKKEKMIQEWKKILPIYYIYGDSERPAKLEWSEEVGKEPGIKVTMLIKGKWERREEQIFRIMENGDRTDKEAFDKRVLEIGND